jgi:hypothetical protein
MQQEKACKLAASSDEVACYISDFQCICYRYYAQAKTIDTASKDMMKDDHRRKEREVRERTAEEDMLYSMYKVTRVRHHYYQSVRMSCASAGLTWRRHRSLRQQGACDLLAPHDLTYACLCTILAQQLPDCHAGREDPRAADYPRPGAGVGGSGAGAAGAGAAAGPEGGPEAA